MFKKLFLITALILLTANVNAEIAINNTIISNNTGNFYLQRNVSYETTNVTYLYPNIYTAYVNAVTDLNTIIGTSNPTEAQQNWAIKRIAEIQLFIIIFIRAFIFHGA